MGLFKSMNVNDLKYVIAVGFDTSSQYFQSLPKSLWRYFRDQRIPAKALAVWATAQYHWLPLWDLDCCVDASACCDIRGMRVAQVRMRPRPCKAFQHMWKWQTFSLHWCQIHGRISGICSSFKENTLPIESHHLNQDLTPTPSKSHRPCVNYSLYMMYGYVWWFLRLTTVLITVM